MKNTRVTPEEVKLFHRLYEKYGTYAAVARETGRSASTISKYIKMQGSYKALAQAAHQEFIKKA